MKYDDDELTEYQVQTPNRQETRQIDDISKLK